MLLIQVAVTVVWALVVLLALLRVVQRQVLLRLLRVSVVVWGVLRLLRVSVVVWTRVVMGLMVGLMVGLVMGYRTIRCTSEFVCG
jgi:hypothetical protein